MFRSVAIFAALCLVAAVGAVSADEMDDLNMRELLAEFLENEKRGDGCMTQTGKSSNDGITEYAYKTSDADKDKFGDLEVWLFNIQRFGSGYVNFGAKFDHKQLSRKTRQGVPQSGADTKTLDLVYFRTYLDYAKVRVTFTFKDGNPTSVCLARTD